MDSLLELLRPSRPLWPALVAILVVSVLYRVGSSLLNRQVGGARNRRLWNQLARVALAAAGALAILVSLPLDESLRAQILQVVGIVLSAGVALSSTTLLGNAMAGLMLRAVRNFRTGDFIEVEGRIGRITERGLIHTEIQTPDRSLTTIPNLWLASHPVTVTRTSGAIVACEVSLGYDVPRTRVTELLLQAADSIGLTEGFVQVRSLNDYSVSYRVAGLLDEVKQLLSRRFQLNAAVLDALHEGGVEIVSPAFLALRSLAKDVPVIPEEHSPAAPLPGVDTEEILFDKAEEAESAEGRVERLTRRIEELKARRGELKGPERDRLDGQIERLEARRKEVETGEPEPDRPS